MAGGAAMKQSDEQLLQIALSLLGEWIFSYDGFTPPDQTQFQYCRVCGNAEHRGHKVDCRGARFIAELTERLLK